jgi:hypothetical protein
VTLLVRVISPGVCVALLLWLDECIGVGRESSHRAERARADLVLVELLYHPKCIQPLVTKTLSVFGRSRSLQGCHAAIFRAATFKTSGQEFGADCQPFALIGGFPEYSVSHASA